MRLRYHLEGVSMMFLQIPSFPGAQTNRCRLNHISNARGKNLESALPWMYRVWIWGGSLRALHSQDIAEE
jgi:hypothetical protein